MSEIFTSEQFAQLFELFFLVDLLSFFAALVVYDFFKGLIVRLFSASIF